MTREQIKAAQWMEEVLGEFMVLSHWRRELHAMAEPSFQEYRTARFIREVLDRAGIEWQATAVTGTLAVIEGRGHGPGGRTVVLRADMDALPVEEKTGADFESTTVGVMHACGHDMHMTVLLGALTLLARHRDLFSGTVLGLFQPGEETNPGGASVVLDEGILDKWPIVAVIGEHVEPSLPTGTFGFRSGKYMASSDELRFTVRGKGGHAALRDQLKDPIEPTARLIESLYGIPALSPVPELPTIVSIGKIVADGATNIVPDQVKLEGTMRTFDEMWRKWVKETIRMRAQEIATRFGVEIDVNIDDGYPCVMNDPRLTVLMSRLAADLFGEKAVVELGLRPTAEDFGYYTQRYPSVFYRLGVGGIGESFEQGKAGRLHTPHFCPDEKALGYGTVLFAMGAMALLSEPESSPWVLDAEPVGER